MRIKFWASVLLVLFVSAFPCSVEAQQSVKLSSGKLLTASAANSQTILTVPTPSRKPSRLRLERDATIAASQAPASLILVAEIPRSLLILIDSYPSNPGGMSYCQAGQESFLRVLSISRKRPRETYRTKLESCRDNLELASPGVEWQPDTRTLNIHWLSVPGKAAKPEDRSIKIGPNGKPQYKPQ